MLLVVLLLAGAPVAAHPEGRPVYTGRSLLAALENLESRGLHLVYSSEQVRPEMIVADEPLRPALRQILDELIIPHGLQAREGPGGTLLIVKAPEESMGRLEGRVVARGDGRPVPVARVRVAGTGLQAPASRDGWFRVAGIPAGTYPLEVVLAGPDVQALGEATIRPRAITRVTLEVNLASALRERITVTPSQNAIQPDEPVPRRSLRTQEIERLPLLGDDLHRAVAWLPGIASGDRTASFSLRGGEEDEVQVFLDGLEIDRPFHLKDVRSFAGIIDSNTIGTADLLTGGLPAEYGDHLSGTLDLTSIAPPEGERLSVGASSVSASMLSAGTLASGEGHWLASARAWYPDAMVDLADTAAQTINPPYSDLFGRR